MTAEVKIFIDEATDVLTVPSSAVTEDGDTSFVRVQGPAGRIEKRKVEVGLDNKTTAEIQSGLEKGERVVVGEGAAQRQSSPSSARRGPSLF